MSKTQQVCDPNMAFLLQLECSSYSYPLDCTNKGFLMKKIFPHSIFSDKFKHQFCCNCGIFLVRIIKFFRQKILFNWFMILSKDNHFINFKNNIFH